MSLEGKAHRPRMHPKVLGSVLQARLGIVPDMLSQGIGDEFTAALGEHGLL